MSATVEADVSSNGNHNSGTTPLETAALAYASGGLHVFPLHSIALDSNCTCGNTNCKSPGKHPRTRHGVSDATTDPNQILAWWKQWPGANIGVATGHGGLYVIDLDGPQGNTNWNQLTDDNPTPPTRTVATGNGRHLWFLTDQHLGNSASRIAPGIDTRGRGGYVVAPPSVHAAGTTYSFENPGSPLANLPTWIIEHLTRQPTPNLPNTTHGDPHALRRLEGAAGKVAIAPEGQRNTVLNWAAYTAGRLIAAERLDETVARDILTVAAQRAGLTPTEIDPTINSGIAGGQQDPDHDTTDTELQPLTVTTINQPDTERPQTSWAPVEAGQYIDGTWEPPTPTQLVRNDGNALLYAGRINLLFGESEAGKGWVALHAIQQALDRDDTVLYIDFEDYPDTIYTRLKLLGTTPAQLTNQFAYIRPDHGLDQTGRQALGNTVTQLNPDLVVLDGITGAMSLHQLDTNASTDVDQFYSLLGEPLARHGATVVFIDHVTKSAENRGKGPIGSQHKRARVSGASYEITSVQPIAPGRAGKLRIKIDKDRLGAIRTHHPTQAGEFHLDSTGTRTVATIHAPAIHNGDPFRPTHAMEAVSKALADAGDRGLSRRGIEEIGGFAKDTLVKAAEALVDEGYAAREPGPNRSLIHRFVSAYTAGVTVLDNPSVPGTSPGVPNAPGTPLRPPAEGEVPGVPRLTKRGTGDTRESNQPNTPRQVPL